MSKDKQTHQSTIKISVYFVYTVVLGPVNIRHCSTLRLLKAACAVLSLLRALISATHTHWLQNQQVSLLAIIRPGHVQLALVSLPWVPVPIQQQARAALLPVIRNAEYKVY